MKKKGIFALAVLFYLFVGLSGFFRFPAAFGYSRTTTVYYDPGEARERTEAIRCRGLPVIVSYCTGTIEAPRDEAPPTPGDAGPMTVSSGARPRIRSTRGR